MRLLLLPPAVKAAAVFLGAKTRTLFALNIKLSVSALLLSSRASLVPLGPRLRDHCHILGARWESGSAYSHFFIRLTQSESKLESTFDRAPKSRRRRRLLSNHFCK